MQKAAEKAAQVIQERATGYKKTTRRFEHYQEAWRVLLVQR